MKKHDGGINNLVWTNKGGLQGNCTVGRNIPITKYINFESMETNNGN